MKKRIIKARREAERKAKEAQTEGNTIPLETSPPFTGGAVDFLEDWGNHIRGTVSGTDQPQESTVSEETPQRAIGVSGLMVGLMSRFKPADSETKRYLGVDPAVGEDRTAILNMTGTLVDFEGNSAQLPQGDPSESAPIIRLGLVPEDQSGYKRRCVK